MSWILIRHTLAKVLKIAMIKLKHCSTMAKGWTNNARLRAWKWHAWIVANSGYSTTPVITAAVSVCMTVLQHLHLYPKSRPKTCARQASLFRHRLLRRGKCTIAIWSCLIAANATSHIVVSIKCRPCFAYNFLLIHPFIEVTSIRVHTGMWTGTNPVHGKIIGNVLNEYALG